jgi:hypothetical protein
MNAGMAFAFAASQPSAREVRFVLRAAIDIAASCRVDLGWQVESELHTESTTDAKEVAHFIAVTVVPFVRDPLDALIEFFA